MRTKIGSYLLSKKIKQLNLKPVVCNLKQAQKIGLVFNAHSDKSIKAIKGIEKYYLDKNITIETMGFSHTKHLNSMLIGDKNHHYVCLKDFNWFYKPKNPLIKDFMDKRFDILINLFTENDFPVEYMVCASQANFKVGSAHLNNKMHDFMIDIGNKKDDITYLASQINHYLNILNN